MSARRSRRLMRKAGAVFGLNCPSPTAATATPPTSASSDAPMSTYCQGHVTPNARNACGMAVPKVSMATSQAKANAGFPPTH